MSRKLGAAPSLRCKGALRAFRGLLTVFGEGNADRQRRRRFFTTFHCPRARATRARWPVAWRRAAPTGSQRTRVATPPRSFSIPPARPTRAQRFDKTAITGVADATNAEPAPTRGKRMRAATPRPLSPFRRPAQCGRCALTRPRSGALSTRRASDPAPTPIGLLRFNRASAPGHRPHGLTPRPQARDAPFHDARRRAHPAAAVSPPTKKRRNSRTPARRARICGGDSRTAQPPKMRE